MNIFIFTGGGFPRHSDFRLFYERVMQDDDTVIAADGGTDSLYNFLASMKKSTDFTAGNSTIQDKFLTGIKNNTVLQPSFIIGDMDSIRSKEVLEAFPGAKVLGFDRYKDFTDTELSLKKAREINADATVILCGGNGGRPDHFLGILETFSSDIHPDVWLCGPQVIYRLGDGDSLEASSLAADDVISIARALCGSEAGRVITEGLEWGDGCMRRKGMPSISNMIKAGGTDSTVTVRAEGSTFLVFLPYGAAVTVRRKDSLFRT